MCRAWLALAALLMAAGCSRMSQDDSVPKTMVALGDSMTRAYAACPKGGDCAEASWSVGTLTSVHSVAQRLDAGSTHNVARSGARVVDLVRQAEAATELRPDYVTVLIGANDACATSEQSVTPVADFARSFEAGLDILMAGAPDARVLVVSIPDLMRLWDIGSESAPVRAVWERGVCATMLADAADISTAATERRHRVRQRVVDYNAAMAAACKRFPGRCFWDNNTVFDYQFRLEDVSSIDYWHPSEEGQATLARVAWEAAQRARAFSGP